MRLRITPVIVAGTALLLAACGAFEPAAARVNGRTIDDDRFRRTVEFVLADPRLAGQELGEEQLQQNRLDVVRGLLSFLIQQQIVDEHAAAEGIEVPRDEVEQRLEAQIADLGGREVFAEQLEGSGATIADVRALVTAQLLRDRVAGRVAEESVSEDDLRADYAERRAEFTQVRVAHILVQDRQEAERIRARATPENFAQLARRFSQDPGSAQQGGDLGQNPAANFVRPFAEAALEIPVGQIGGPVRTDFGFHVIHVIDREMTPFEEAQERLVAEGAQQAFSEWLLGRLETAEIRVNPRYGFFDAQTGRVIERRATTPEPEPQVAP